MDADIIFDIATRQVLPFGANGNALNRINRTLGDASLLIAFQENDAGPPRNLPANTVVRLGVKPKETFGAAFFYLDESAGPAAEFGEIDLGEDWGAGALIALFDSNQKYVDLTAQLSVQLPTDANPRLSVPLLLRLYNSVFVSGGGGALAVSGTYIYWSWITRLTGGVAATDLDAQPIAGLAVNTLIKVVTTDEGSTEWRKELWEGAPDPVTDAAVGRIVPPDFDNDTMNYVLMQK